MGSTYGTLETQMLHFLGNRDDDSTKAMLMVSFNWFQNVLSKVASWDELEKHTTKALTLDDYDYHLTTDWSLTDFRKLYTIKLYDGTRYYLPMDYVTPVRWDQEFAPVIHYGSHKPTHYTIRGNYVLFNCRPEASLFADIWYYAYPTAVTTTLSTLDYKTELDPILICMAVGITWLGLEEVEQSNKWLALGSKMLKDFGVDGITVEDMKSFGQTKLTGSDYWKDPFVKGVR
jgi:hypothetical protein